MKKVLLPFLFCICVLAAQAFHIVGGEIEFIYLNDGFYQINLTQYFDEAQDENPGPETSITVYIFSNSGNELISTHNLSLLEQEDVLYTNPECAIDELQTSKVIWSGQAELDPVEYADEEGYYISWERCCRNADIKNIENPAGTGMEYVLEIPPLMKNGQVFKNSSPILFQPLGDYACVNQLYYIDFVGIDPDGDSLVYSLTTPLNSSSLAALPTPTPKPHIEVLFKDGYSLSNAIPGSPPLNISNKGLLTVTPSETGLFVFSVLVEEYRNKEKIGAARRDFQMLVIDGCEPPDPPVVDITIPGNPAFNADTDTLSYIVGEAKCFDFLVSNITDGETITLRAEGVNFDGDLDEIFTTNEIPVDEDDSQLIIEVCIPDCPPLSDEPFILDLIAGDNACPLPQLDTLRLTVEVEPPPNEFPITTTTDKSIIQVEDDVYTEVITAIDNDLDSMTIGLFVEGLADPITSGFSIETTTSEAGDIEAIFQWDTDCQAFDFSEQDNFQVGIFIEDLDTCLVPNPDIIFIDATVILPANEPPVVSANRVIPSEVELGTSLTFDVSVSDSDNDDVSLLLVGANFDLETYGIVFDSVSGNTSASSTFSWDLACDANLYDDGREFEFWFIGDDADKCKVKNYDTLKSTISVRYPANQQPEFDATDQFQTIYINELVEIEIAATDEDFEDEITLSFAEGFSQPASETLRFESVTGSKRVVSTLAWQPDCSIFRFGETSTLQDVVFQVIDNACPISNLDTLKITFEIVDNPDRQAGFFPPNVFTPNGDNVNDTFTLSGNGEITQNLPPDNCDNVFEYIVINNRAGQEVFRSSHRDFVWTGGQFPAGVYYYLVKYSNSEFKGYVHILR